MSKTIFVQIATVVFTIIGLVHLYRAFYALPANFMGWQVPIELSWVVGIVLLFLAYSGYRHCH